MSDTVYTQRTRPDTQFSLRARIAVSVPLLRWDTDNDFISYDWTNEITISSITSTPRTSRTRL